MTDTILQPSFIGGEAAPELQARVDIARLFQAAERIENFVVDPLGGLKNRPGSEKLALTKLQDGTQFRLHTFSPSASEFYILEFGHRYLRVYTDEGPAMTEPFPALAVNDKPLPDGSQSLLDGVGGGSHVISQGFKMPESVSFKLGAIELKVLRTDVIPGLITVEIWSDDGNGLPLAPLDGLSGGDLFGPTTPEIPVVTGGLGAVPFSRWFVQNVDDPRINIAPGTQLHVVVSGNSRAGEPLPNFAAVCFTDDDRYTLGGMNFFDPSDSTWKPMVDKDLCFRVLGRDTIQIELVTPYDSAPQDDLGTEADIVRLVFEQSVDVMYITDPSRKNSAMVLKRFDPKIWTLEPLTTFVSHGAPTAVVAVAPIPSALPVRSWEYAAAGVSSLDIESLPTRSPIIIVGADISQTFPVQLKITGGEPVDHYAIYKGRDNTLGFIGVTGQKIGVEQAYTEAYNRVYQERLVYYRSNGYPYGTAVQLAQADARAAGEAAASLVSGGVNEFVFMDDNIAPIYEDGPRSAYNPFTPAGGLKPAVVAIFQQRLVFGNIDGAVDTILLSETGDFLSWERSIPTVADDSMKITLASGTFDEIRWLVALHRGLFIGTAGAEYVLTSEGAAVTPTDRTAPPISYYGSGYLQPLLIGRVILFADRGGHVRELLHYQNANDAPDQDLSLLASHLFTGYHVTAWAYVQSPSSIVYAIRNDGVMLAFTYVRDQSIAAWSRQITDGKFRALTSAQRNGEDGQTLYVVAERIINGVTSWFIERIAPRSASSSPFVDCSAKVTLASGGNDFDFPGAPGETADPATLMKGSVVLVHVPGLNIADVEFDKTWLVLVDADGHRYPCLLLSFAFYDRYKVELGTDIDPEIAAFGSLRTAAGREGSWKLAKKVFGGFGHLVGEEVSVQSDRNAHPRVTVAEGGVVSLNDMTNELIVGLAYTPTLKTLNLAVNTADVKSKQKIVNEVGLDVAETKGLWAGEDENDLQEFNEGEIFTDPELKHGRISVRISNTWGRKGSVIVKQVDPLPCTILSASPEVGFGN